MRFDLTGLEAFGYSGPLSVSPCLWGCGLGHRPYFENYTVDASILQLIFGSVAQDDLKDH
jgi:hypothetical protein